MKRSLYFIVIAFLVLPSCTPILDDEVSSASIIEETAQQVGDVMASIDESSGASTGNLAGYQKSFDKMYAKYVPSTKLETFIDSLNPTAVAASCSSGTFSTCSSNTITRTFSGCTVGTATFNGSVSLVWGGSSTNCQMGSNNDTITRTPNFTMTGRRNATLYVTKPTGSIGQVMTWLSGSSSATRTYSYANYGINRKFVLNSTTLYDQTTATTSALTVTSALRYNRVLNGGTLRVTNNITGNVCTFSPTNVTWGSSTCNCPTQGSWSGSCTSTGSVTLEINGCGSGTYTEGSDITSVTFDRCGT